MEGENFKLQKYAASVKLRLNIMDVSRFLKKPAGSFFLLGPRGTGKSWWAKKSFPRALIVDLLDAETLRELAARPERLGDLVRGAGDCATVVVDEVQKLPELLEVVHRLIEERCGKVFVLTGSSARKLRRAGVNLLGGRAGRLSLHPYMAAELGDTFSFEQALRCGLLPVVVGAEDPDFQLRAYCGLYFKEEVQAEGLVRNIGAFARFMEVMSFSHGSVLNLANAARECAVKRSTLEGYLSILEDLLLGWRLPVFTRRAKRELASHPKFYFFDAGVFRANRPKGPLDEISEIEGPALEGLVAQHLRAWCDYSQGGHALYYWQTRSQVEVDFLIYGESGLYALEVKNTRKVRQEDLAALKSFAEDYPESQRFLLYRGSAMLVRDGIRCIPCETFLRALKPNAFPDFS
jgi:predicted AAA+ superfamily ATPase